MFTNVCRWKAGNNVNVELVDYNKEKENKIKKNWSIILNRGVADMLEIWNNMSKIN
jgi:hypothetical protein